MSQLAVEFRVHPGSSYAGSLSLLASPGISLPLPQPSHFQAPSPSSRQGQASQETLSCQVDPATEREEGKEAGRAALLGSQALAQGDSHGARGEGQGCRALVSTGCAGEAGKGLQLCDLGKVPLPQLISIINGEMTLASRTEGRDRTEDKGHRGGDSLCWRS